MSLSPASRIHFVGVGGVGMSAIAKVLIERGFHVTGSDLKGSRAATMLEAIGAEVTIGHEEGLVDGADLVVISSAIPRSNPEYARAEELGIEVITRGAALALLLDGTRSIVVSGTHGKTTTTSMIATVARTAGLDPTYLIGAGLNDIGTNARAGSGDLAIAESDESDGSFLLLAPSVAVVTNIELDHVDHWSSLEDLRGAFERFIDSGPADGSIVVPAMDEALVAAARSTARTVITFGPGGDVASADAERAAASSRFDLLLHGGRHPIDLRVPGMHNVWNAVTSAAACAAVGIPGNEIAEGLGAYRGVERRFQIRGTARGVTIVDDYAHHPTEIRATLEAARHGGYERIVAVFQPHRYSRTRALAAEFGTAFSDADLVLVMDVYSAGETPIPGVSGRLVADAVAEGEGPDVRYFPHRDELMTFLMSSTKPGDVVLTLGAGDVTTVGDEFLERAEGA